MGLDICVHKMVKIPKVCKDIEDLKSWDKKVYLKEDIDEIVKNNKIELYDEPFIIDDDLWKIYKNKLPKEYIFDYKYKEYDWKTIFKNKGLDFNDYEWTGTDCPNNNYYDLDIIIIYNEKKNTKNEIRFNTKDIDKFKILIPCKAFLYEKKEYGYMRKGANRKFYDDGMWSDNILVLDKKTLKEHMMKYFEEEKYYFDDISCRQYFKQNIFDKFKDNCGMFVLYC